MGNTCAGVSSRAACGGRKGEVEGEGVCVCVCRGGRGGGSTVRKRKGRQEGGIKRVGKATTSSPLSGGEVVVSGN